MTLPEWIIQDPKENEAKEYIILNQRNKQQKKILKTNGTQLKKN